jgi:hypothetical protein
MKPKLENRNIKPVAMCGYCAVPVAQFSETEKRLFLQDMTMGWIARCPKCDHDLVGDLQREVLVMAATYTNEGKIYKEVPMPHMEGKARKYE